MSDDSKAMIVVGIILTSLISLLVWTIHGANADQDAREAAKAAACERLATAVPSAHVADLIEVCR